MRLGQQNAEQKNCAVIGGGGGGQGHVALGELIIRRLTATF